MKRNVFFVASVVLFTGVPLAAFAISYQPGQTLDPSCPPSDPTCIVVPNTTSSSFTATSTTATSTFAGNVQVAGTASSTNVVVSGSLTLGSLNGILKAVAGVVENALVNLATDVTGILGISNGGTGVSVAPTYGQLLIGNGSGGYTLAATSSLGIGGGGTWGSITGTLANQTDLQNALNAKLSLASWYATTTDALAQGATNKYFSNALAQGAISVSGSPLTYSSGVVGINQANGSQSGFLASADWTNFNGKLASSSLSTSALLASLVSDETGGGSLVFANSPTFAGTPTFGGGVVNYSVNSTTTIPNGTPYAWTVATSSSATPLIEVDTSGSSGAVSIGSANSTSSSFVFGATGQPANLIFAASSTIEGAGNGQAITIGANNDVVSFGVNVGIGTSTPAHRLSIWGAGTSGFFDVSSSTSGDILQISPTGYVGIGTTSPGSLFSVGGVANWTGATTTYYASGGINLTGGCFSINGTCIGGSGGGPAYTFSYPLSNTANTISLAFGTTTANSWSQLQTFGAGASTTNLVISGLGNTSTNCLQISALGVVSSTGSACGGSGSVPGGSPGQVQFNSASTFGGASNLWWDSANSRLGIGTSSPYAELSVATPPGASGSVTTLFSIASSTATGTTTLFSIDNTGNTIDTLAASSTFAVGANGLTNPAFQILASTTNAANGLQLVSN